MIAVDKKLIHRKLKALQSYLSRLEKLRDINHHTFLSDDRNYALAEHYLQLSVETVLDVCRHLVVALELKIPDDSHSLLPELSKAGILSKTFVERNLQMPGFRNRLVHVYEDIDHKKTYEYLQEHLADFQDFIEQVSKYLLKTK